MSIFSNEFRTRCIRCGGFVEAWAGKCTKVGRDQIATWPQYSKPILRQDWLVEHLVCAEKYRGTDVHFRFNPVQPSDLPA